MSYNRNGASLAAGSALALIFSVAGGVDASAQEARGSEVDTLVITATKRAADIQDVPMSVTAFSGDYLEQIGANNAEELMRSVPSVGITQSNNNRNTTVFVRGIGTSGTNPGIESSVGIFIDGVYVMGAGSIQSNLTDVSSIEILRGPQGTLYGRNTPVGAININTRVPDGDLDAFVSLRVGDYNARQLSGYVGGGSDTLAGRLTFWTSDRDGYQYNLSTNDDVNGKEEYGLRGRVRWEPFSNLTGDFVAFYTRMRSDCCTAEVRDPTGPRGLATPGFLAAAAATGHPFRDFTSGDHVVDDENVGLDITEAYGVSGTLDYDLGGGFTLTSITGFNAYQDDIRNLPTDMLPQSVVSGSNQFMLRQGWSEEIRLTSPDDGFMTYILGAFLFAENLKYGTQSIFGADANRVLPPCPGTCRNFPEGDTGLFRYWQETESAALFGQATFNLSEAWRINAGLRYSWDSKDGASIAWAVATPGSATGNIFPTTPYTQFSRDETQLTWSAGVEFDVLQDVMLYGLAATGYKTGGFNARAATPNTPIEFDAETTMTYELGVKSVLFNGQVVLNADVYHMTLEDFQDSILNPVTGTGFIVGNAGERQVTGFEMDATWRPIEQLTVRGSAGYMDAEFTDYSAGTCNTYPSLPVGTLPGTCSYTGLTPSQSPEWMWSLSIDWLSDIPGTSMEWFARAAIQHSDGRMLEPTLDPRSWQPATDIVDADLGIQAGAWRLRAFGRNLTDEAYYLQTTLLPLNAAISGGGATNTVQANGMVGWLAAPRTFGVELSYRY